jgi:hypothetical protein
VPARRRPFAAVGRAVAAGLLRPAHWRPGGNSAERASVQREGAGVGVSGGPLLGRGHGSPPGLAGRSSVAVPRCGFGGQREPQERVEQEADGAEQGQAGPQQADQGRAGSEGRGDFGADPGDDPVCLAAAQAWVGVHRVLPDGCGGLPGVSAGFGPARRRTRHTFPSCTRGAEGLAPGSGVARPAPLIAGQCPVRPSWLASPASSRFAQYSATWPSWMRYRWIASISKRFPVGGLPWNSPVCVPR